MMIETQRFRPPLRPPVKHQLPARLFADVTPSKAATPKRPPRPDIKPGEPGPVVLTDPRDWLSVKGPERGVKRPRKISDQEVLDKLRQEAFFVQLYEKGCIEGFQTRGSAELALCRLLCSATKDLRQVKRLFRGSKLVRPQQGLTGKILLASSACGRCGTCEVCRGTIARFPGYRTAAKKPMVVADRKVITPPLQPIPAARLGQR